MTRLSHPASFGNPNNFCWRIVTKYGQFLFEKRVWTSCMSPLQWRLVWQRNPVTTRCSLVSCHVKEYYCATTRGLTLRPHTPAPSSSGCVYWLFGFAVRPECFDHTSCISRADHKNVSHLTRGHCAGHFFIRLDVPQAVLVGLGAFTEKCKFCEPRFPVCDTVSWLGDLLRVLLASAPVRPALYLNEMNVLKKAINSGVDSSSQRRGLLSWRCALVNGVGS